MGLRHAFEARVLAGFLLAAGLAVAVGGERLRLAFRYDRAALEGGELHRLVTGHFAHLGWAHLALNGVGIVLCFLLVGTAFSALQWLFVFATCIAVMDLGFWFLLPQLDWYVGLSGLLHGILAAGAIEGIRQRSPESALILLVLVLKLAYEAFAGPLPGSENTAGGSVVTEAHLFGAAGGALAASLLIIGNRGPASI